MNHNRKEGIDRILGYAEGGKLDPEEVMRRMKDKYGTAPLPEQKTPPPPPPPAPEKRPDSLTTVIQNRRQQLERIATYAQGGSVLAEQQRDSREHRHNKRAIALKSRPIEGPGTATSDSIPAQVQQTGEPIKVSTGERILSVKQDALLQRIAKLLGFDSVDALLEAGTGAPVGPTDKKAFKDGGEVTTIDSAGNAYTPEPGFDPGKAVVNMFKDSAEAARTKTDYDQVKQNRLTAEAKPAAVTPTPVSAPAPVAPTQPGDLLLGRQQANMESNNLRSFQDVGGGTTASRGTNGRLNVTNVGTADVTDPAKRAVDDSASAQRDLASNGGRTAATVLENMQRLRLGSDARDNSLRPELRNEAAKSLADMNAAATATSQAAQANQQTAGSKLIYGLQQEAIDDNNPRQAAAQAKLKAMTGHGDQKLQVVDVEEPIDPKQPLLGNRRVPNTFNPQTGELKPAQAKLDPTAQAKAAIARGADPRAVNARLKAMGLPEIK